MSARTGVVVAIDGPSGSGKSSTSRGVATRLGLRYLDTGAMYRAMTWWLLRNGVDVYHGMPRMLAPQLRIIFADLLHRQTPLAYNCSAGQDRTGFTTAMILSALGVSREQILAVFDALDEQVQPQHCRGCPFLMALAEFPDPAHPAHRAGSPT